VIGQRPLDSNNHHVVRATASFWLPERDFPLMPTDRTGTAFIVDYYNTLRERSIGFIMERCEN
jgi:hypothetical protein